MIYTTQGFTVLLDTGIEMEKDSNPGHGAMLPELSIPDQIDLQTIDVLSPSHIILSPGPKRPEDAGICVSLVEAFYQRFPILGVCLGHQAIASAFGVETRFFPF